MMVYLFHVVEEKTQKSSFFCKFEETLKEQSFRHHSIYSSSRSKIEGKGKDEPADPDSQESWLNNCCRLQQNLVKSVSCRSCHADVTLLENASASSGLGSSWIVSCENKHCLSRNSSKNLLTNLVARAAEFRSCKGYFPPGATFEPAL